MTRPRLIFVNRVYWPATAATAQLLTDLAESLAARGWPVHIICAGQASGAHQGVIIHRTGADHQLGGLCSRVRRYGDFNRRAEQQLATLAGPNDIVVLMTDPPLLGAHLTDLALRRGARVIHWIQDIYPEIITAHLGQLTAWPLWPWRVKRNAAWQAAQGSVTLSASMVATIAAAAPTIAPAIIPNWAPRELQVPPAAEAIATCRAKWGLADKCIVAYSGNLGRVHEFKTILAAAARLKNQPEIAFLFIGSGAHFDGLRSAATARQLTNISFLPPVSRENLAVALAATDIQLVTLNPAFTNLVYPSKLAGALAAERPVLFVGPARGEIAQLLTAEDCGRAVSPGDDEALAAIITQWQLDLPRRHQLARKARAAYTQYFTVTSAVDRWVEILQRVATTVKS